MRNYRKCVKFIVCLFRYHHFGCEKHDSAYDVNEDGKMNVQNTENKNFTQKYSRKTDIINEKPDSV